MALQYDESTTGSFGKSQHHYWLFNKLDSSNQWRLVNLDPAVSSLMTGITAGLLVEFVDDANLKIILITRKVK